MVNVILTAMVLIGTIAGKDPVAVFSIPPSTETLAVSIGQQVAGCVVAKIEPKRVTLQCGGKVRLVDVGQSPQEAELEALVKIKDNSITLSRDLKGKLEGVELATTMMQLCSEAVPNPDGTQKGYKLFEIDAGSIFQVVGFQNGDVVTDIDGQPLNTPLNAVSALMEAKRKDRFTVGFVRGGVPKTLQVSVQ